MPTERCPTCKMVLYEWRMPHTYSPRWECVIKDFHDENDPEIFHSGGFDERAVAEDFIASRFDGEGREWEVWVRKNSDGDWKKFNVTLEEVPSFTASPV